MPRKKGGHVVSNLGVLPGGVPFTGYCDSCRNTIASEKVPAYCPHCGALLWTVNDLRNMSSFHPFQPNKIPELHRAFFERASAGASPVNLIKE